MERNIGINSFSWKSVVGRQNQRINVALNFKHITSFTSEFFCGGMCFMDFIGCQEIRGNRWMWLTCLSLPHFWREKSALCYRWSQNSWKRKASWYIYGFCWKCLEKKEGGGLNAVLCTWVEKFQKRLRGIFDVSESE